MKNSLKIFMIAAIFICPGLIQAQIGEHEALKNAMERTDEVIMQAREVVSRSNSERAKSLLSAAISLQERAMSLSQMFFPELLQSTSTLKLLQPASSWEQRESLTRW